MSDSEANPPNETQQQQFVSKTNDTSLGIDLKPVLSEPRPDANVKVPDYQLLLAGDPRNRDSEGHLVDGKETEEN